MQFIRRFHCREVLAYLAGLALIAAIAFWPGGQARGADPQIALGNATEPYPGAAAAANKTAAQRHDKKVKLVRSDHYVYLLFTERAASPRRAVTHPRETVRTAAPAAAPVDNTAARSGGYRAWLGSMRSEAGAGRLWREAHRQHPRLLAQAGVSYKPVNVSEKGRFYRVLAGPFDERADAAAVCDEVKTTDDFCRVVR